MSFPVYTLEVERARPVRYEARSSRRDPPRRACVPRMRLPVFRVVLRRDRTIRVSRVRITNASDAHEAAFALLADRPFENMVVLLVSAANDLVGAVYIATSSAMSSTAVATRGIFTAAIVHNAAAIILAHNHPSGDQRPSREDIAMTERARAAAEIMGIPILDHLIVTRDPERWGTVVC